MRYFRIEDSFEDRDRWYLRSPQTAEGDDVDPRSFTEGRKYKGPQPLSIPLRCGTQPLDFTLGSFDMPVVKKEMAERLEFCATKEIERIPVKIIGGYGWFDIVNALTVKKAISEELSEIRWWTVEDGVPGKTGKYAGIAKLVLNRKDIGESRIFRLQGWELPLIVCESVKNALEKMNVSGITFKELRVV